MIYVDGSLIVATIGRLGVVVGCDLKARLVLGALATFAKTSIGTGLHIEVGLGLLYLTLHVVWMQ